jgi:cytochrome c-type biogenesis protein CcmH
MTAFISAALLLSLMAAAFLALPLLRAKPGAPRAPWAAGLAVLGVIAAGAGLYAWLGDRGWLHVAPEDAANRGISILARHLEREPQDLNGWMTLGQDYGELGNYALALRCFQRANRLSHGSNAAALAAMGEAMILGGDPAQAAQAPELLERALLLDPKSPKALFYSAVAAYQQGNLELARERFTGMINLPPPENIRVALQHPIDDIDVTLSPSLAGKVPEQASLFVFVRAPEGGPPLAAKHSAVQLPQDVDLSSADAMVAGRAVQPGQNVSVVARISVSGNPLPQSGDLYGEIRAVAGKSGTQALQIDRLNP